MASGFPILALEMAVDSNAPKRMLRMALAAADGAGHRMELGRENQARFV
jgi:hypothetical protein